MASYDSYHRRLCFITSLPVNLNEYELVKFSHYSVRCICPYKVIKGHRIKHGWDSYCVTQDKKIYSLLEDIRTKELVEEPPSKMAFSTTWIPILSESKFDVNSPWNYIPRDLYKHVGNHSDMDYKYYPPGFDFKYDYLVCYDYDYEIDINKIERVLDQIEDYYILDDKVKIYNMRHEKFN